VVPDAPIIVGRISGLFGVRGQVRVFDFSRRRGDILAYDPWLLKEGDGWVEVSVREGRPHQDTVVVHLEGLQDREAARKLIGTEVAIRTEQLANLDNGEYFWHQLEGLAVVNAAGNDLGIVDRMMETGANDVLVVRGDRERLIPYTPNTIVEVNLPIGQIQVDWELEF
jgi:16S rRNA processing protein RimM